MLQFLADVGGGSGGGSTQCNFNLQVAKPVLGWQNTGC